MKKMILTAMAALSISATASAHRNDAVAFGISLSPTYTTMISTLASACGWDACKEIIEAQEDASAFVASEGQIRTARLEKSLSWVRSNFEAAADSSDFEIAAAILSVEAQ